MGASAPRNEKISRSGRGRGFSESHSFNFDTSVGVGSKAPSFPSGQRAAHCTVSVTLEPSPRSVKFSGDNGRTIASMRSK